jgi:hypothetical protein
VRLDHDPALTVQGDDGLAHRDAADAELGGYLVLGNTVTDAELALEDLAADVVGDLLGTGGAVEPPRRRVDVPEWLGKGGGAASDRNLPGNSCLPTTVWLPSVTTYPKQSIRSGSLASVRRRAAQLTYYYYHLYDGGKVS